MSLRYPRPATLGLLGPGHNVVDASAGTGKTFLLKHHFVDLVLSHGVPVEQILVVTFTEKAVAELVLGVRDLIHQLADLSPDHALAKAAASAPPGGYWLVDERARERLRAARLACQRASIFTIHGFCQRVLREHAFVQGRLFDEELVDGQAVFGEALREVLRGDAAAEPGLHGLLDAWLDSGESIQSLARLLRDASGQDVEEVLPKYDEDRLARALRTWTAVAADDDLLKQRLKRAGIHGKTANTIVDRLARVSRTVAACPDAPLAFLARAHGTAGDSLAEALERLDAGQLDDELRRLTASVRELHAAAVPLPAVAVQRLLPIVRERAAARKRGAGRYDYDDMLKLVGAALAHRGPAGRALLASLRDRYRHGLIDEFQDTDGTQWPIFRRIFVEAADDRHGLTVVGDPKQAIYAFRGADVHTYLAARRALLTAGASELHLDVSFRATPALLEATSRLFRQPGFFRPGSGIAYDRPVSCGQPERGLVSTTGQLEPPVMLLRLHEAPDTVSTRQVRAATANAIAAEIRGLTDPASTLRLGDGRGERHVALHDIFVLTFTNDECLTVGQALARAGIRHAFYKLGEIFASPEAREIRDVLFALVTPEHRGRRGKALLTRFFGLDLPALAALRQAAVESRADRLLLELAELGRAADVPTLFSALVERTAVLRRELWQGEGERGLTNILHVLELLQAEWAERHATLPELALLLDGYVRGTAAPPGPDSDLQRLETDEDAVRILTIHKAKGLEANVVFLFGGLGEGRRGPMHLFHEGKGQRRSLYVGNPEGSIGQRVAEESEDEQSRLCYVALTRARYRLYLPQYPAQLRRSQGPYRRLQRLLDEVAAEPRLDTRWLFGRRSYDLALAADVDPPASPADQAPAAMPPDLLATPPVPPDVATIRRERAGFLVTSYSTVKRLRGGLAPDDEDAATATPPTLPLPSPERLPGGAATGIFLHELLAVVPLPPLAARPDFPAWYASVTPLFARMGRRHGRPTGDAALAADRVYAAYATPVRLDDRVVPGLASASTALREMEFLYPMPEPRHLLLGRPAPDESDRSWRIERGVVRGFVDLLFEHAGRVYVCDWKSDELPNYEAPALARHCQAHYDVQERIYTLAVLRMLGIANAEDYARRWGGMVFCFLRGRISDDDRRGIHFHKPDFAEVLGWEREMEGQVFWGIAR